LKIGYDVHAIKAEIRPVREKISHKSNLKGQLKAEGGAAMEIRRSARKALVVFALCASPQMIPRRPPSEGAESAANSHSL
jgi:hypothetical protein